jgi:hypothetical protein
MVEWPNDIPRPCPHTALLRHLEHRYGNSELLTVETATWFDCSRGVQCSNASAYRSGAIIVTMTVDGQVTDALGALQSLLRIDIDD